MLAFPVAMNGHLARLGAAVVSALIVASFFGAAWRVLPHPPAPALVREYRAPTPPLRPGLVMPVFVMRPDHSVIRSGSATVAADGRVRMDLFSSTFGTHPSATRALLMEPSLGVLWAAASDTSQVELRRRIALVQDQTGVAMERVISSRVFNEEYRPVLRAILTEAVSTAWSDPRTQDALQGLLANADPALRRLLRGEGEEILLSRLKAAVWEMVRANWSNALAAPFGYGLDYEPAIRAATATFADPRIQRMLVAFGRSQLETPEARQLAERIAIGVVDSLLRDRRVPGVVTQMFWDQRLRVILRPLADSVFVLLAGLPQHLGGLGSESSLNPLAAYVFKAFAMSARTPLVLLVTPSDLERLARMDGDDPTVLTPVAAEARP